MAHLTGSSMNGGAKRPLAMDGTPRSGVARPDHTVKHASLAFTLVATVQGGGTLDGGMQSVAEV
jgi:hypothetical protein